MAGRFDSVDDWMEFFAQDMIWLMLGIVVILWFTGKTSNQKLAFFSGLSAALSLLLASWLVSPMANHPRPFVGHTVHLLIRHAADPSFPSDHATLAFSLAFSVLFVKRRLGTLLLAMAVLVGISRIYVGVHYPGDILGAMLLSGIIAFAVRKNRERMDGLSMIFIRLYRKLTGKLKFLPHS